MYIKIVLFLLSFAMLACSSVSVSMQGKGFEEFPQVEIPELSSMVAEYSSNEEYSWIKRLVSVKESVGVVEYELTWTQYFMINEEFAWAQRPDTAKEEDYGMVRDLARPEGAVVVDARRSRLMDEGANYIGALPIAGFNLVNDRNHTYTKEVGETFYITQDYSSAPMDYEERYGYLIKKPKASVAEVAASLSWPTVEEIASTKIYAMLLLSKVALAEMDSRDLKDWGDYVDMETALAALEAAGFIEDSSLLNNAKQKALVGSLRFSPKDETMILEILDADLVRMIQ